MRGEQLPVRSGTLAAPSPAEPSGRDGVMLMVPPPPPRGGAGAAFQHVLTGSTVSRHTCGAVNLSTVPNASESPGLIARPSQANEWGWS